MKMQNAGKRFTQIELTDLIEKLRRKGLDRLVTALLDPENYKLNGELNRTSIIETNGLQHTRLNRQLRQAKELLENDL